jgi:hypothetical protein
MEWLVFLAVMAIFAQWKFASPFLPSPTLNGKSFVKRNAPFIIFLFSGTLMSVAMKNFTALYFYSAFAIGLSGIFFAIFLAYKCGDL